MFISVVLRRFPLDTCSQEMHGARLIGLLIIGGKYLPSI